DNLMKEPTLNFPSSTPSATSKEVLQLGKKLGQRQAFAAMAGRCSAADAALLRDVRESKLYLATCPTWDEFCVQELGMHKATANRIIAQLEEFGPEFFEIAQLTRVSPAAYRAIAPAIRDKAIHWNGEVIALIPENSERLGAAIEDLRKSAETEA